MADNKVSNAVAGPAAHIRRPLSVYGWCGALALETSGPPCPECCRRHAAYEPQPSIAHASKEAGRCVDYREVGR